MYFLYRKSFLLFAVSSLTLYTGAIANECEDQYDALTFTNVCGAYRLMSDPVPYDYENCPASCQESLDTLDAVCSVDGATINGEPYQASTHLVTALTFLVEPCKSVVEDELLSQGVDDLTLYTGAIANECEDQYDALFSVCVPVEGSDQCPAASCQESLDTLVAVCSVDGATFNGEPYQDLTKLGAALVAFAFADEPCTGIVADELISQADDTCQDWGTVYLSIAFPYCRTEPGCTSFCEGVQDNFYRSCAVNDVVMTEDSTTGEMVSLPVSQFQFSILYKGRNSEEGGIFQSNACKEYGEGKEFEGSSTSSSSVSFISIFPVILSLVVSSVCFPSSLA